MTLAELLTDSARPDPRLSAVEVSGMTADSRAVRPGHAFFAIPGNRADGLTFVPQALAAGAAAVIAERAPDGAGAMPFVRVGNVRRTLALAAARLYPRQPAHIAAVTGTSGKTSVAAFTRQIWASLGHAAASIGTVGLVTPAREVYGSLTTPDPVELHRTVDGLAGEGITHLAIEASSHGLDQHRLDGLRVSAAGFTNLSRDHLDYHPDLGHYFRAKLRLFEALVRDGGAAVISADHEHSAAVAKASAERGLRVMTVGRMGEFIRLTDAGIDGFAQRISIRHGGRDLSLLLPLVGAFQIENALVAAGLAIATGGEPGNVFSALETLRGAKGRLDLAGKANGAPVFVDYAHKPDALEKALDALRPYASGRLIVVFGCGGDRDAGKRPLMGEIAAAHADAVIVTDDNPRSEDPAAIRAAILAAAPGAIEIGDRGQAIRTAVSQLRRGDVLLVAGKGHETGQIAGGRTLPFSDHDAVASAIGEFKS